MPASYEGEALKAQAVCARTYAWKQIQQQNLDEYGADVDDSVNYQVYGNSQPQVSTTEAVNATEGRIITQNGEAVEAYYFSTSAGVTATDEIWGAETAAPYLKSVPCRFDENMPWSRWHVKIPWEILAERAAKVTGEKGKLLSLSAEKTDQNGAVTGLRVITEATSVLLENEHTIREFLSPEVSGYYRKRWYCYQRRTPSSQCFYPDRGRRKRSDHYRQGVWTWCGDEPERSQRNGKRRLFLAGNPELFFSKYRDSGYETTGLPDNNRK